MKQILLIVLFSIFLYGQAKPLNVLYISHSKKDQPFAKLLNDFSKAVANDLNINLKIVFPPEDKTSAYGDLNRYTYESFAKPYFFSNDKPDVIISILFRKTGKKILEYSKMSETPVFIVNTNIPTDDKEEIKAPREVYKNFLGLVAANEKQAGKLLFESLLKNVKEKKYKKNIEVIGISGPREAYESIQRENGLKEGIENRKEVFLRQITHANWSSDLAYKQTLRLLNRYPELDIIWTASDSMAIGALKAINEKNKDICVGGIDWSQDGINSIENKNLDVSVGGHFMNGGIALILLYDYFNGIDFKDELGTEINFDMFELNQDNIEEFKREFSHENWSKIDFKEYSKFSNPSLKNYDFSLKRMINSLNKNK